MILLRPKYIAAHYPHRDFLFSTEQNRNYPFIMVDTTHDTEFKYSFIFESIFYQIYIDVYWGYHKLIPSAKIKIFDKSLNKGGSL